MIMIIKENDDDDPEDDDDNFVDDGDDSTDDDDDEYDHDDLLTVPCVSIFTLHLFSEIFLVFHPPEDCFLFIIPSLCLKTSYGPENFW